MPRRNNKNEDADYYGYSDTNTSGSGDMEGIPIYATNIGDIVATRKKKNRKPNLIRKLKKIVAKKKSKRK